jgi:hypothetical protein
VPASWKFVVAPFRTNSVISEGESCLPGTTSRFANERIA